MAVIQATIVKQDDYRHKLQFPWSSIKRRQILMNCLGSLRELKGKHVGKFIMFAAPPANTIAEDNLFSFGTSLNGFFRDLQTRVTAEAKYTAEKSRLGLFIHLLQPIPFFLYT
ncbi:uncharacterized protein LOC143808344 [Ranitomeya variabilis]|uniref:uncharacterized protein LOC143808344 n=1 Tax=Ranitomeya variabilis TaxID=490064 RepID=UPI0040574AB0